MDLQALCVALDSAPDEEGRSALAARFVEVRCAVNGRRGSTMYPRTATASKDREQRARDRDFA